MKPDVASLLVLMAIEFFLRQRQSCSNAVLVLLVLLQWLQMCTKMMVTSGLLYVCIMCNVLVLCVYIGNT